MKQIITSLDLGTNSIKIIVGEIFKGKLFVLACSEVKSKGIKKGLIVDGEKALESIKEAFKRTEDVLGIKINKVIITVPSYYADFIPGEGYTTITREEKIVTGEDITRAMQASVYNKISPNLELINVSPAEFVLNDQEIVKDPKGHEAYKLSVTSVLGTVPKKNVYTLISILETLGIDVVDLAFGGQADYYEFKLPEYKDKLGAVINIGTGKTEISIINEDILVSTEVLEIGGRNVDRDISYIYELPLEESKNLKEKFALAHKNGANTSEIVTCLTKENENIKINQYEISEIVYSRIREILELSKKQINLLTKKDISYIIITGGTTEIDGFDKVYREIFGKMATVTRVNELGVRNNRFSSALGAIKLYRDKLKFRDLVASTISEESQEELFSEKKKIDGNSLLGKVYSYFFDN
jgi:cell division protein FtsA